MYIAVCVESVRITRLARIYNNHDNTNNYSKLYTIPARWITKRTRPIIKYNFDILSFSPVSRLKKKNESEGGRLKNNNNNHKLKKKNKN